MLRERLIEAAEYAADHEDERVFFDLRVTDIGICVIGSIRNFSTRRIASWIEIEQANENILIFTIDRVLADLRAGVGV